MRHHRWVAVPVSLGVLLAALAGVHVVAQQQTPQAQDTSPLVFRAEANYVEVDAVVTDAQGRIVSDLRQDEFQLLEEGKPQTISAFSLVDVPVERLEQPLFAARPVDVDVQTNTVREGRLYMLVLDDLHTDPTRTLRVKAAARRFIERNFGSNDVAAVVFTGSLSDQSQDFTSNPRLLLQAIEKFQGHKLPSTTLEQLQGIFSVDGTLTAGPDADAIERPFRARQLMQVLHKEADFLAGVRGRRKTLVLISEGIDYDIYSVIDPSPDELAQQTFATPPSAATALLEETHNAVAAATRANVIVYAIDPRGLTTGTDDLAAVSSTMPDNSVGASSAAAEQRLSRDSLNTLAADTGGFAAVNQNDFDKAFDRIQQESSTYYLLGFYPANEKRDGKFRKLQVRVTRPGLTVRARSGYIAPRGKAPEVVPEKPTTLLTPELASAVASPLPVAGLPLRVFAAPFKGTAPNAAVALAVELDASALAFTEKDGTVTGQVEVVTAPVDGDGKRYPIDRRQATLTLKPEALPTLRERGIRVLTQMDLPPGRYQLRVAAGDAAGTAGSVIYDLAVPDFSRAPFSLSGIALTSMAASGVSTVRAIDPLADFLPAPLSATREFDTGDIITIFGEVYERTSAGPSHQIAITTQLLADGGQVVFEAKDSRASTELHGTSSGGYGFNARIPLADVAPGVYVLHVEAQAQAGERPTASRDIEIHVR